MPILPSVDLTQRSICDTFLAAMDTLTAAEIRDALATTLVGRTVHYWPTVGSTMDEARRLAEEGAPEGTVVLADEQTTGRGRLQRSWWAPSGSSLLLSLLFRPSFVPLWAQRLTMICSLAVCDAISEAIGTEVAGLQATDRQVGVKWPNDVLIEGRKVCGILTELEVTSSGVRYAIVGIGINVNVEFEGAPRLMSPATSLLIEAGRPVSRREVLVAVLTGIERRYLALLEGQSFHQEWAERLTTLGHPVQVRGASERWEGLAIGVDEDGALLVRTEEGSVQRVLAGDVTLRPAPDLPGSSD
ncbi:MAG: biotin--[acetyl-CoA-carboxylase] ligase [Anaerolineae bacterium]|nr:biotin--[acetyl-CoA-carboxylase] ligase [Anaerolineae bacterium]